MAMEGCGGLKQLEDYHSKAVHIHFEVVGLMPGQGSSTQHTQSNRQRNSA
jgi:hypothetical protein